MVCIVVFVAGPRYARWLPRFTVEVTHNWTPGFLRWRRNDTENDAARQVVLLEVDNTTVFTFTGPNELTAVGVGESNTRDVPADRPRRNSH